MDRPILSIPELLWNFLVRITPSALVQALDKKQIPTGQEKGTGIVEGSGPKTLAAKSEAMRRILGFEGTGGFLTHFQRNRSLSGISNFAKSPPNDGLPGLGNWDNSCYQNSVIQGLASLPSLASFLDHATSTTAQGGSYTTIQALRDVIEKLNDPLNTDKRLWTPAELKSMSSWQQQDAQEYYSKVLDEMEKEISRAVRERPSNAGLSELKNLDFGTATHVSKGVKAPSCDTKLAQLPKELASALLRNPLEGLLAQRVGCLQCGFVEGLSLIPFNCLTVPLGKQFTYDIQACLDEYTKLEPISGVECSRCTLLRHKQQLERLLGQFEEQIEQRGLPPEPRLSEALRSSAGTRLKAVMEALEEDDFSENTLLKKCQIPAKSRVPATKSRQAVIARSPKSLVMHINRSVFDETTGIQRKNLANVRFPKNLDLSPWCLGTSLSKSQGLEMESWNIDPSRSMLSDQELEQDDNPPESACRAYVLRAVVTHYGRHENGHYICYRRDPRSLQAEVGHESKETWWRLSDDDVSKVSEESVLGQGGVFMLFYELSERDRPHIPNSVTEDTLTYTTTSTGESVEIASSPHQSSNSDSVPCNKAEDQTPSLVEMKPADPDIIPTPAITHILPPNSQPSNFSQRPISNKENDNSTEHPTIETDTVSDTANDDYSKKENRQITPRMRTAGPRNSRASGSMTGNAMPSVSSMVIAN